MARQPVVAQSTAVALRLPQNSSQWLGSSVNLAANPEAYATARTVLGTDPVVADASAIGLGAGASPYYRRLAEARQLNSSGLTLYTGGGTIEGVAQAEANAVGRGDTTSTARALNTGLAGLKVYNNYFGDLLVGRADTPFEARATARGGADLPPPAGSTPTSRLDALSRVRGIETSTVLGQPNATVAATTTLDLGNRSATRVRASGQADAVGLDRVTAIGVTSGNGDGTSNFRGDAIARLQVQNGAAPVRAGLVLPVDVSLNAVGINRSSITGSPALENTLYARGLALLDVEDLPPTDDEADADLAPPTIPVRYSQLTGIGVNQSAITAAHGNATLIAEGGIFADGATAANSPRSNALAAGFNRSTVITGAGDDLIVGRVLSERDVEIDSDGDGVFSDDTYLVDNPEAAFPEQSFNGFRRSTVITGAGDDTIRGSSNESFLFAMNGNNTIDLDRSRRSSLWSSFGDDLLKVRDRSENVVMWGSLGDDVLQGADSGFGNSFDGGLGTDVISGTANARDQFLFTDANAALTAAASNTDLNLLNDTRFWASLSEADKQELWTTGRLSGAVGDLLGGVDTLLGFEAGVGGDQLVLNSSLASITQDLWNQYGSVLKVDSNGRTSVLDGNPGGSNGIAVAAGSLADIQKLGIGTAYLAYATDTRQLMYDADGDWRRGSISFGTVNTSGPLSKDNFRFGSTTGAGMGTPSGAGV
ncbi:hypothetical protein KBZ12_16830 [Cyanobium sp. Cruz CV13-4-11]|jgi:hypothetical protein|uniref:hypothetical protein n=1 Tax=unclassified Cyanobium TaxID=2627006 RepID=UPI0020CE5969|nr:MULTISPECIES: hypothetical protein [unclassified Cyanobium]MCP9902255.1 hypothetical protein [Cyanobium sp. Cruz CV11-17]MCP9921115.1 hypothetical protein [Cyanobium sp. Cruz CV13-4-11]